MRQSTSSIGSTRSTDSSWTRTVSSNPFAPAPASNALRGRSISTSFNPFLEVDVGGGDVDVGLGASSSTNPFAPGPAAPAAATANPFAARPFAESARASGVSGGGDEGGCDAGTGKDDLPNPFLSATTSSPLPDASNPFAAAAAAVSSAVPYPATLTTTPVAAAAPTAAVSERADQTSSIAAPAPAPAPAPKPASVHGESGGVKNSKRDYTDVGRLGLVKLCNARKLDVKGISKDAAALRRMLRMHDMAATSVIFSHRVSNTNKAIYLT